MNKISKNKKMSIVSSGLQEGQGRLILAALLSAAPPEKTNANLPGVWTCERYCDHSQVILHNYCENLQRVQSLGRF